MKHSISRKLLQTVIVINFLALLVVTIAILLFTKGFQNEFLLQDYAEERDFILSDYDISKPIQHRTKNILIEFIPNDLNGVLPKYPLFQSMPEGMGMSRSIDANTYLINIEKDDTGVFYHARDITQALERERLFFAVIIIIAIATMLFSLVLSYTGSQRIIQPLKHLSDYIASSKIGEKNAPITTDFQDIELHNIAVVFNNFLVELEQFVLRERSLVGLASHELKTPVAIIVGAVEILKSRFELPEPVLGPLTRIENASEEMSTSIPILLELSRRSGQVLSYRELDINEVVSDVIKDLSQLFPVDSRISIVHQDKCVVTADKALAKMLIRNLIQNALQHTSGKIHLSLSSHSICIRDQGTENQSSHLQELATNIPTQNKTFNTGLGLYIVTLITERLNWSLDISSGASNGSTVAIMFSSLDKNETRPVRQGL